MTINVTMSQEEFIDYISYKNDVTSNKVIKHEINDNYNKLLNQLLEDGIWKTNNKYDNLLKNLSSSINKIERSGSNDNSTISS